MFADVNFAAAEESVLESHKLASHGDYRGVAVRVDTSSDESVQAMVEGAFSAFGRIDYSVNSAGVCLSQEDLIKILRLGR